MRIAASRKWREGRWYGEDGRATVFTARWGTYGGSPALLGDKRAGVLGGDRNAI
jgi:hypothetical protein